MADKTLKQKILVVDDVPLNIKILHAVLKDDYDIFVATSGEKALTMVESALQPDLILLDIMMPRMDGYEVCRRLKENKKTKNIPVIFVSGKGGTEDETKGRELGAVDYITKPLNISIIKATVKTHLDLKKQIDQIRKSST